MNLRIIFVSNMTTWGHTMKLWEHGRDDPIIQEREKTKHKDRAYSPITRFSSDLVMCLPAFFRDSTTYSYPLLFIRYPQQGLVFFKHTAQIVQCTYMWRWASVSSNHTILRCPHFLLPYLYGTRYRDQLHCREYRQLQRSRQAVPGIKIYGWHRGLSFSSSLSCSCAPWSYVTKSQHTLNREVFSIFIHCPSLWPYACLI